MSEMNAIDLDHLLKNLTPEQKKYYREKVGTALGDQLSAAHEDVLSTIVEFNGLRSIDAVNDDTAPSWLRLGALDAFIQWVKGEVKTCQHVMSWRSPMPVLAAAWRPGYVSCEYCAPTLFKVWGDADKTCDGCGHICDVDNGDLISVSTIIIAAFGFQAGVCANCDTGPDETADGNHRTGRTSGQHPADRKEGRDR